MSVTPLRRVLDQVDEHMAEQPPADTNFDEYGPPILRAPKIASGLVSNAHRAAAAELRAAGDAIIENAKRDADSLYAMAEWVEDTGESQAERIACICNTAATVHQTAEALRRDVLGQMIPAEAGQGQ